MILLIISVIILCYAVYLLFKEYERLNYHIIALWEEIRFLKEEIHFLKESKEV